MSLNDYIDDVFDLEEFVNLCHAGLAHGVAAKATLELMPRIAKVLRKPELVPQADRFEEVRRRASKLEAFAREQNAQGFPYLWALATVRLWTILEAAVDELVEDQLRNRIAGAMPAVSRLKGTLIDFLNATDQERTEILLQKLKESTDASLKKGCGRFETLLDAVGLGGPIPEAPRRVLFELSEIRNVLIHRNSKADRRFQEACPWFGAQPGRPICLVPNHYHMYLTAVSWYLLELSSRVSRQEGKRVSEEESGLHADLAAGVQQFLDSRVQAPTLSAPGPAHSK